MDNSDKIYRLKVWEFLDNMKHTDNYLIEDICVKQNRSQFISCVKNYMNTKKTFQGYICFNRDYNRIYKTSEITFKKEKK